MILINLLVIHINLKKVEAFNDRIINIILPHTFQLFCGIIIVISRNMRKEEKNNKS